MGISAYQERVPLQLMDFAYRYTSSVLSDALYMQNEGYDQADIHTSSKGGRGAKTAAAKAEEGDISIQALRMSAGSRMAHQFSGPGALPKEFLKQLADERNRISLNLQAKEGEKGSGLMIGGVRLPHEKYCLTGVGWGLKEEWDSEGEESEEEQNGDAGVAHGDDAQMDGIEDEAGEDEDLGTMEDVFGDDGGGADKDGDEEMQD
jgi:transcription initiation factor TFIID subunit 9B